MLAKRNLQWIVNDGVCMQLFSEQNDSILFCIGINTTSQSETVTCSDKKTLHSHAHANYNIIFPVL